MKTSTYLLVLMSIVSFSVFATENIEPDNDQLLLASCQALKITPAPANAKPCSYFIQGFLAAAQAIDPPIIDQQTKKSSEFRGFMSRPYRNRGQIPPTRFFPFCVADDESIARVVKIVSKQLSPQTDTVKMLRDTIFKALKNEYPCDKSKQSGKPN